MSETSSRSRAALAGWIAAGVALLAAAAAGVYAANLRNQNTDIELRLIDAVTKLQLSEQQRGDAVGEVRAIHANLGLLSAPDLQIFPLSGRGIAREATGRIYSSKTKGLLFSATGMPPLEEGSVYQIWMQTKGGPVAAGLAKPADDRSVTAAYDPVTAPSDATGFAVSVEPEDGSPKPTSELLMVSAGR